MKKVAIYIPTTVNVNVENSDLTAVFVREAKMLLSSLFGGFTAFEAMGGWVSQEHGLVEEKIFIVQSYSENVDEYLEQIIELAKRIAIEMGQEAVTVETNNGLMFIEPTIKMVA